jgi:hypothetical protein
MLTKNGAKHENCNLLAEFHSVLNFWDNYFRQLLNATGINNVIHTEMYIAEPLVHQPSSVEVEVAIET